MSPKPRLVVEHPNNGNSIPFSQYQSSSPEKFSVAEDTYVVYAGGTSYMVRVGELVVIDPAIKQFTHTPVAVFVINTSVLLWSYQLNLGIELPYQSILLHALQETKLYLQIESSPLISTPTQDPEFTSTVDLEIIPNDSPLPETLNNNDFDILTKVSGSIESLYQAMAKCSDLHYDSNSDSESMSNSGEWFQQGAENSPQIQALEVPQAWLHNVGDADDLEDIQPESEPEEHPQTDEAGMHVDVGYGPIVGVVRKRDSDDNGFNKARKM